MLPVVVDLPVCLLASRGRVGYLPKKMAVNRGDQRGVTILLSRKNSC
jgi:hypothetical protein